MNKESNPIKELFFEYIANSQTIPELIIKRQFDKVIKQATADCYDIVLSMDEKDNAVGIFATGLLHYLLTCALVKSQRVINYKEIELDVVIPDIKTLEQDPKKALIICIPKSSEINTLRQKIMELEKIQPEKDNIWMVLSEDIQTGKKTFVLSQKINSFSNIIFEIAQFSNVGGSDKFKILKI